MIIGDIETFEWGSDGDPISGNGGGIRWVPTGSDGDTTKLITTDQHYAGTRSLELFGGTSGAHAGVALT